MIQRPFWRQRIEAAWREAPIAWLCGVRRSGKTTLAESLGGERMFYVNCDLPTVEDMVRDPQVFFRGCSKPVVVFDEIHQLRDPARVLKIGADGFPKLKILATGSSTRQGLATAGQRPGIVFITPCWRARFHLSKKANAISGRRLAVAGAHKRLARREGAAV